MTPEQIAQRHAKVVANIQRIARQNGMTVRIDGDRNGMETVLIIYSRKLSAKWALYIPKALNAYRMSELVTAEALLAEISEKCGYILPDEIAQRQIAMI